MEQRLAAIRRAWSCKSEYDLAPGEDPEFEGPTEDEYYYEFDYEFERAEYEDEHELE